MTKCVSIYFSFTEVLPPSIAGRFRSFIVKKKKFILKTKPMALSLGNLFRAITAAGMDGVMIFRPLIKYYTIPVNDNKGH